MGEDLIKKWGPTLLAQQRAALLHPRPSLSSIEPLQDADIAGAPEDVECGNKLLQEGKVGCIILAGGHGTRLGSAHPKGMFPVSLVKKKSLFQLFCEKSVAAAHQAGTSLPVAIMTSPHNHAETRAFLEAHQHFGLKKEECSLFTQGTLPYLDEAGNWFSEAPGLLAEGADGNGLALFHFFRSGIWEKWKQRGIEQVNLILIDNPLADPFDPSLLGYQVKEHNDVTVKAILRKSPEEKVGVLGKKEEKLCVVEYFELPEKDMRWKLANISLFCFSMSFIEKCAQDPKLSLPWHTSEKKFQEKKIWKYETFIFDLLPYAQRASVLLFPREEVYAPLKNASGENSLKDVQAALQAKDRRTFAQVTGIAPPMRGFELDVAFSYPTPSLLKKWKGKELPNTDYIEA